MLYKTYQPLCKEEEEELEEARQADKQWGFLSWVRDFPDPRQSGKVQYPLDEILLVALCSVLCGEEGDTISMQEFGDLHLTTLRRVLPFHNGIPSPDTFRRVLSILNPRKFADILLQWNQVIQNELPHVVAIDGKTIRGSLDKGKGRGAIHILSAYATESRVVLAQRDVSSKTNEIKVVPKILDLLDLRKTIVTIDAMGCQKSIAAQIAKEKGDYVLALKCNQGTLHELVQDAFSEAAKENFPQEFYACHKHVDKGHGRIEERMCVCTEKIQWLGKDLVDQWPGLRSLVMVHSRCFRKGKWSQQRRFFLSSLPSNPQQHLHAVRSHWGIESMHWSLDMTFGEDANRTRVATLVKNVAALRKFSFNLLQTTHQAKKKAKDRLGKRSLKRLRRLAAGKPQLLWEILSAGPIN